MPEKLRVGLRRRVARSACRERGDHRPDVRDRDDEADLLPRDRGSPMVKKSGIEKRGLRQRSRGKASGVQLKGADRLTV